MDFTPMYIGKLMLFFICNLVEIQHLRPYVTFHCMHVLTCYIFYQQHQSNSLLLTPQVPYCNAHSVQWKIEHPFLTSTSRLVAIMFPTQIRAHTHVINTYSATNS